MTNLTPGTHIDVSVENGRLTFRPDKNIAHANGKQQYITINRTLGGEQRAPIVISPEAAAMLRKRGVAG